jgi:alkyldihydroxyacetonephosphate synthase
MICFKFWLFIGSTRDLQFFAQAVRSRSVNLGRIHISAAQPVLMKEGSGLDVKKVAEMVQTLQRTKIMVSKIHVSACASVLDIDEATVCGSVQKLNCDIWYEDTIPGSASLSCPLSLPTSATERWALFLHFGHFYAKYLEESHPIWAGWLAGGSQVCHESSLPIDENTRVVVKSLQQLFESADKVIETTKRMLHRKGFERPAHSHILQYAWNNGCDLPRFLLQAALSIAPDTISSPGQDKIQRSIHIPVDPLFNTRNVPADDQLPSSESFGAWGYKDSGFILNVNKNGSKSVTMKGDRYKISGRPMPKLVPFLESETKSYVDPVNVILPKVPTIAIPRTDLSTAAIKKLRGAVGNDDKRLSITDIDRARHGTGHSQEDIFMIRTGTLSQIRLPDAVICPEEESEIEQIVLLAKAENWCLIPFGGGTNVCHATWCPPKEKDPRFMISVDMRLMNKILSVNEEDSTIHVQAGITGGDLVREMMSRGYTIGHEPDSIEFSTLGGWIATKASGMKQNRYGNIEGIVKEVRVMTSKGKLWQHNSTDSASYARVSTGTDLTALMLGSEGSLGIITSAVVKIWPLPKVKEYESVILHKFDDGIRFMKEVSKLGALKPASVRLLDNTQFRLGQAMKSNDSFLEGIKKSYKKFVAGLFTDRFDPNEMVCATITLEGSEAEVKLQTEQISKAAKTHGGLCAGSDIGRAGYDMTYAIAYIRDFAMTYGFLAESFETFVPWSKVKRMITATKNRLKKEHEERALPGCPVITCRITQLYDEGVCVYFYFCMNFKNVENPSTIFAEIEMAARNEIMANGGSLSHHHGVGKHRAPLMDKVNSKNLQDVFFSLKDSIDPDNIFGVRNGTYASF